MKPLSIPQAAEQLNISESLLRRYCRQGRLGVRIGGRWLVYQDELDEFAKKPRPVGYPKGRSRKS
jgi:excisionase family DNA binding protein